MRTTEQELDTIEKALGLNEGGSECTTSHKITGLPMNLRALRHGSKLLRMYGRAQAPMTTTHRYRRLTKMTMSDVFPNVVTESKTIASERNDVDVEVQVHNDDTVCKNVSTASDPSPPSSPSSEKDSPKQMAWFHGDNHDRVTVSTDLRVEMERQEKEKKDAEMRRWMEKQKEMEDARRRTHTYYHSTQNTKNGDRGRPRARTSASATRAPHQSFASPSNGMNTGPRRSLLLGTHVATARGANTKDSGKEMDTLSVTSSHTQCTQDSHDRTRIRSTASSVSSPRTSPRNARHSGNSGKMMDRLCKFGKRCRCASSTCLRSHTLNEWEPRMCSNPHHTQPNSKGWEGCLHRHHKESKEECLLRFTSIPNTFYHDNRQIYLKTFRVKDTHHRK